MCSLLLKKPRHQQSIGDLIEVVRLTNNEEIIHCYHDLGDNYTPIKVGLLSPVCTGVCFWHSLLSL